MDALVAPAWVLPGQTDDQLLDLLIQWRSSRSTRVGPRAGDQPPMPTQQRVGLDEEARPADSGEDAADRSEQGAVSRLQPRAWNLAAQHTELVAQHEDLQVLAGVAAAEQGEQLDGAAQRQVGEFRQHQVGLSMDKEDQGHRILGCSEPPAHRQRPDFRTPRVFGRAARETQMEPTMSAGRPAGGNQREIRPSRRH